MNSLTASTPRADAAACIVVTAATEAARPAAVALARTLGLPFHDFPPPATALHLTQTETHLELREGATGARLRVEITAAVLRRYRAGGGPLRRAVGAGMRQVVDATAGLGTDTVHLVALGHRVTAIERNPVVGALACDGFARASARGLLAVDNPRWLSGDARVLLPTLDPSPATIYLDPMFPPKRKKSAAVRKEMSLLRRLLIDDADAAELLALARTCPAERVVVKRPLDAPPLAAGVTAAYAGKLVRYDVYRSGGTGGRRLVDAA